MATSSRAADGWAGSHSDQLVVFALNEQRYALRLSAVERIVRVVEFSPLPKAPDVVLGVVNIQGEIVPVFHLRKRVQLPDREIDLSDHLIIARASGRMVALVADAVTGVVTRAEEETTAPDRILPGLDYIAGVVKLDGGLVFIHDLDTFLSVEEAKTLEQAMASV